MMNLTLLSLIISDLLLVCVCIPWRMGFVGCQAVGCRACPSIPWRMGFVGDTACCRFPP